MKLPIKLLPLTSLCCALLVGCTGTEESLPALRLIVLTDGGSTLGYVLNTDLSRSSFQSQKSVVGGVQVDYLNSGRNFALTLQAGVENRDVNLNKVSDFAAPPAPCLTQSTLNALRDRLLTFSDCNGTQQLALYRVDGTLVWTALLPTNLVTVPGPDTPPTRIAAGAGDTAVVARADLTGGSEVILVKPNNTGDPVQDATAVVALPVATVSIRDLAAFNTSIYAATDTGVRPLLATGVPDPGSSASVTAFGSTRTDRLWSGSTGGQRLLAAWRDNLQSGNFTEPLKLWDGALTSAVNVANVTALRDVAFALDGRLYALTSSTLISYDTVLGLAQGNWSAQTHLGGLNDARQVTWVVSPETP